MIQGRIFFVEFFKKKRDTQHDSYFENYILVILQPGMVLKKPAKKYMSIQLGVKLRKPSILVVN